MKEEPWLKQYWRPLMAYQYLLVCLFDFVLAPILTMILSKYLGGYHPWEPLTLKESGYYHMAMGAILGVAAWTRGQENLERTRMFGQAILQEGQNPPSEPSEKQGG